MKRNDCLQSTKMRRVSLESAYQIIDKENIGVNIRRVGTGLKNKKKSNPLSPLRTGNVKRSAVAGVNTKNTPPRFRSTNTQNSDPITANIDSTSNSIMGTNYQQQPSDIGKEENEDFSFAKLKGAAQKFEQKQKKANTHQVKACTSVADSNSAPQYGTKLEFKRNISNTSKTIQTEHIFSSSGSSSSSSFSNGKLGFGNLNQITSCSSFGTIESNTSSFSASSWSGDFDDDSKNTATRRNEDQNKGRTNTTSYSSESTSTSTSLSKRSIPSKVQAKHDKNEDFSFKKLKQKALGMEKATGTKRIILPCPQPQQPCPKQKEEEAEDFSFESLKQKALKPPSTPIRKKNNYNRIAPHTICARPRRPHGIPTHNVSSLSFTPRSTSKMLYSPRSNSTPKERSQHFSNTGGNSNINNLKVEAKMIGHHTICGKSRQSQGLASSGIAPSVLFHNHRSHSTPKDRIKESSDNKLENNPTAETKSSTYKLNRFQFKPKIKKEEVQATNDSIASVQKLSKWLSDDPFDKKKQLVIRKGEQIANKSKAFEHEELMKGKLKESRAQREKHYFPTGKVSQNKDWLQNRAFGDGNNKECDDKSDNGGVMGRKQLIESALKKRPCGR